MLLRGLRRGAQTLGTSIHLVAFLDYLTGRTTTFTEADLNDRYKRDLAFVAKRAVKTNGGKILGSNRFVYNQFWVKASEAIGQGTPNTPLDNPPGPAGTGTVEDMMYFLGGMTVKQEGDNYVITDIYDFDDYFGNPEAFDQLSDFAQDMEKEGLYRKVRSLASWRQASGYGGFRVEIRLPVSLADNTIAQGEEESGGLFKTARDYVAKYGEKITTGAKDLAADVTTALSD